MIPWTKLVNEHGEKLKNIKVCLFDVDGVMTNGQLYWLGEEVGWNRFFHAHDGYGLKVLMSGGIKVGVISGGDSLGVKKRFQENLNLDYVLLGNEDKREAFQKVLDDGHKEEEILYMGDEFFDLPILKRVGFSATVPNASPEIKEVVDYVSHRPSGMACAREVMDLVRIAHGIIPKVEF